MSREGEKMTEIEAMPEGWEIVRLGAQSVAIQTEKILAHIYQTRMTWIGRIFTDIFNPRVSASSAQSAFYRIPPIIDDGKKPQMKAPRVTPLEGVYTYACGHTWVRSREPAGFRH